MGIINAVEDNNKNEKGGVSKMSKYKNKKPPKRMKQFRLEKGYSLSTMADVIGVEPTTISYWENGGRFPRLDKLRMLEDFFGESYRVLLEDLQGEEIEDLEKLEKQFISDHSYPLGR